MYEYIGRHTFNEICKNFDLAMKRLLKFGLRLIVGGDFNNEMSSMINTSSAVFAYYCALYIYLELIDNLLG